MKKKLLSILITAGALSADTLVLRDGSRIEGNMLSATNREVSFVDANGKRQDYSITNVQEIRFSDTEYPTTRSAADDPTMASQSTVDLVTRLTDDLGKVMERSSLSSRQTKMLEDSRNVISRAGHDLRENLSLSNRREVQMALDNVRYVMSSSAIRAADRRVVLDDIGLLREKYPEFATSGSGTRTRSK